MNFFRQEQQLPIGLEEAWRFFSNPRNLEEITPPSMGFRIVELDSDEMYSGQIITYRIRLMPLVWVDWVTEIKNIVDGERFTDEQKVGPYALWHHTHSFEKNADGVLMRDAIHYHVGFGPIGWLAEKTYVNRQVRRIFEYRERVLAERFGQAPSSA